MVHVTLHVSVWVEMKNPQKLKVTWPSRSTWACELKLQCKKSAVKCLTSRSTWACELKLSNDILKTRTVKSRSTWACELKLVNNGKLQLNNPGHAPRERVSWNNDGEEVKVRFVVTLHVSVWVEILLCEFRFYWFVGHAPRERVSWNWLIMVNYN